MNELKTKTTTDCVIINTMPLMVKEYNNRRVVTFKDIDTLHQRPDDSYTASREMIYCINQAHTHCIDGNTCSCSPSFTGCNVCGTYGCSFDVKPFYTNVAMWYRSA